MSDVCYVTSDLHLGNGVPDDPLEDFWQDAAFAAWVGAMGAGTTLVLNGDVFECAQVEPLSVDGRPDHLAWNGHASLTKIETIIVGHPTFFAALGGLVDRGGTVVFTIGNHDLDLAFDAVQHAIRSALGCVSGTTGVVFKVGTYDYHGVHISHGHELTPENCPAYPLQFVHPFASGGSDLDASIERVWGTDFVLKVFNHLEARFPFVDNVKPTRAMAWQGIKHGWLSGADVVRLVGFLATRGLPMNAIGQWVLSPEDLEDRVAVEIAPDDAVAAVSSAVAQEEWTALIKSRAHEDPAFAHELAEQFAALDPKVRSRIEGEAPTSFDGAGDVTDAGGPVLRPFERRELEGARRVLETASHVVYGHTHKIVDGALGGKLFNPGTWIPRLHVENPDVVARVKAAGGYTPEILSDPSLYNFQLRAVRIRPLEQRVDLIPIDADLTVPVVGRAPAPQ